MRPLIEEHDNHSAVVTGLALRLAHVLSGGVPGLLVQTNLKRSTKRIVLDLGKNRKLFKGEAVQKLISHLADVMKVTFLIK